MLALPILDKKNSLARFHPMGLLLGWVAGIVWGSWTAWSNGLKPLASFDVAGVSYVFYVGLGALILNIIVAVGITLALSLTERRKIDMP